MSARKDAKVGKVMGEFKRGTLKSSSGKKVTNRKQALAIANSEGNKVMRKKMNKGGPAKKKKQGDNARKDEQLGMTRGKESGKKMSMKGRRDVAKATRKKKGSYGFKKKGKA